MRYLGLFIFCLATLSMRAQTDTIFTDDLRTTIQEVFSELDENTYNGKLIERSLSDFPYVYEQIQGKYDQTHNAVTWLLMLDAIIDAHVDTTEIVSKADVVTSIFDFYQEMESIDPGPDVDESLTVPFSLVIHKVNAFDSTIVANGGVINNNGKLQAVVPESTLYREVTLKSAAALEFYSDNGFDKAYLKYDPRFVSTSPDIELTSIRINTGSGFMPLDSVNNQVEYYRYADSLTAQAEVSYYDDAVLVVDTISFYLTLDVGATKTVSPRAVDRWDTKYTYRGLEIDFRVAIKYGCGNGNKIRRPIIIAPPYRPTIQPVHMNNYYDQFDFKSLLSTLSEMGYDVIFLKEKPGNASIETAGRELSRFIRSINIQKTGNYPGEHWENILMGFSAGGQHARYALMLMEKEHMHYGLDHHHTRLYVPFDSPHHGANIPMFAQATYYELDRKMNILAMIAYSYLRDEGSKDMAFNHILAGNLSNTSGDFWDINAAPTSERLNLLNELENGFTHYYTHTQDLRKTFPAFTRNIAVSVGSYASNYTDAYGLNPGHHLFSQDNMFLPTSFGFMHKFRRLYASKYGNQQETLNIHDVNVLLGIIPITTKRIYRTNGLYDLDMAQGGYKNEFYDKFFTGAIPMMLSGFVPTFSFFGQQHYKGNISFMPTVSALGINPTLWQNNNLSYNLQSNGLMYQEFDFDPDDGKSDIFGYPHLGNPANHFQITPFEAVYADPYTYEHIKMQKSVDVDNAINDNYLVYLRDFILNEVEADVVCLQNKVIGENHINWLPDYRYKAWYKAQKTIRIGYDVTPKTNMGNFTIKSSGDVVVYAGESIEVASGWEAFHVQQGATWHAFIGDDGCDRPRAVSKSGQPESTVESLREEAKVVREELVMHPQETIEGMQLYPNPNEGNFTVHFPETGGEIRITNLSGKQVLARPVVGKQLEIRKDDLSSGVYFVIWLREGYVKQTIRMIVQ
ncbi:hypothetical protein GCM10009118_25000 [Wandonia haliotis]|uniref:Secretion system C-terminal sorting domain-containing protein n=1 Tax=Wandonia haliotis TaxID=574963 RepID=A0ABN1MRV5_9FLAO